MWKDITYGLFGLTSLVEPVGEGRDAMVEDDGKVKEEKQEATSQREMAALLAGVESGGRKDEPPLGEDEEGEAIGNLYTAAHMAAATLHDSATAAAGADDPVFAAFEFGGKGGQQAPDEQAALIKAAEARVADAGARQSARVARVATRAEAEAARAKVAAAKAAAEAKKKKTPAQLVKDGKKEKKEKKGDAMDVVDAKKKSPASRKAEEKKAEKKPDEDEDDPLAALGGAAAEAKEEADPFAAAVAAAAEEEAQQLTEDEIADASKLLVAYPSHRQIGRAARPGGQGQPEVRVMYGNESLYVCIRLHQVLFERLAFARDESAKQVRARQTTTPAARSIGE